MSARASAFVDASPIPFEVFRATYPELSDEAAAAKYERYLDAWATVQRLGSGKETAE